MGPLKALMSNPPPIPPLPPDSEFPSDPRYPRQYPEATGKGDIHIPGAGTFGMAVLVISLSTLFIASIFAYLFIRSHTANWDRGMPRVPNSLWFSTIVILLASVTIQKAHNAIRRGDEKRLTRNLIATFVIGVL